MRLRFVPLCLQLSHGWISYDDVHGRWYRVRNGDIAYGILAVQVYMGAMDVLLEI